jgi:GT2 family glycosyltransferase
MCPKVDKIGTPTDETGSFEPSPKASFAPAGTLLAALNLSILIVNWNTRDKLEACLASIEKLEFPWDYEVIVVDNNSCDGSADMVASRFPWARLIASRGNTGYAVGNNLAFAAATGNHLLTLNPDTEFTHNCIVMCVEKLSTFPQFGAASVRLILPDGTTQRSVRGFPTLAGVFGALTRLDRAFPLSPLGSYTLPHYDHEVSQEAPQPMGTFLLFRREALAQVGDPRAPFDEAFPIFFNEVDLMLRLHQKGWKCWHLAEGSVLHHHGSSTRQVKKAMIWESHKSLVRYWSKHLQGPERLLLPVAAVLSYAAAFIRAKGFHAGFRPEHHHLQLEHH